MTTIKTKKYRIDHWSCFWSFRVQLWQLWFGANLSNPAFFVVWHGKAKSWQYFTFQNPHFMMWRN